MGEEGLRMNLGKEETVQNEVEMLETPVIGSPNNEQGGGLRPAAFRLPNCKFIMSNRQLILIFTLLEFYCIT